MNHLHRLRSFVNWPPGYRTVSPVVLANAGFEYTGHGDRVVCPVCGLEIEGWLSGRLLHPKNEHRVRSPNCLWVSSEESESSGSMTLAPAQASYLRRLTENNQSPSGTVGLASIVNSSPSSSVTSHATTATRDGTSTPLKNSTLLVSTVVGASNREETTVTDRTTQIPINRTLPDLNRLKVERTRLDTYFDWPKTSPVRPPDLARTGLFYTGSHDRVRCVYCGGILHHWTKDDVPATEHRIHFPECPFVRGLDVGNVPLDNEKMPANKSSTTHKTADALSKSTFSNNRGYVASSSAGRDEMLVNLSSMSCNAGGSTAAARREDVTHEKPSSTEELHYLDDDIDEQQRLESENRQLLDERTCKVCMDKMFDTVFLPCGHLVSCQECAPKLRNCPVCRTYIRGTVKSFFA